MFNRNKIDVLEGRLEMAQTRNEEKNLTIAKLRGELSESNSVLARVSDYLAVPRSTYGWPVYDLRDFLDKKETEKKRKVEDDRIRRIARQELIAADIRVPLTPQATPEGDFNG